MVVRTLSVVGLWLVATFCAAATSDLRESDVEWGAWGAGPGGGKFSPATQIDAGNVDRLRVAWQHRSGDFREAELIELTEQVPEGQLRPTTFMTTPIMVNDTLYYCTPFNRIFALDAQTGAEKWSFDPEVDTTAEAITNCRGVSSWQTPPQRESPAITASSWGHSMQESLRWTAPPANAARTLLPVGTST